MEPTELYIIALKEELQKKEISQKKLAAMIGIRPPHLSQFLSGKRNFSERRKVAIAETLDLSYVELITRGYRLKHNIDPETNMPREDVVSKNEFTKKVKLNEFYEETLLEKRDENKELNKKNRELKSKIIKLEAELKNLTNQPQQTKTR